MGRKFIGRREEGVGQKDSDLPPQRNGRKTERQREREIETETERDRQTERQRDRQRETETERESRWNLSLKGAFAPAYKVHSELRVRGLRAGQDTV